MTPTNSLLIKTSYLKTNEVFKLQVCKLMLETLSRFEIEQSCFTPISMVHTHKLLKTLKKCFFYFKNLELDNTPSGI